MDYKLAHNAAEGLLAHITSPSGPFVQSRSIAVPDEIGHCTGQFWWDDYTPLLEFPLLRNGGPCGYVITSADKSLPPVLEFCLEGPTLHQRLTSYLTKQLATRNKFASGPTWYYVNALELIAMVRFAGSADLTYLSMPSLEPISVKQPLSIVRDPNATWGISELSDQWDHILVLDTAKRVSTEPIGSEKPNCEPAYYQQNCRALREDKTGTLDPGDTYCSPKCIAGCSPVALTMFACSLKNGNIRNRGSRIWPGSRTYYLDWSSFADPENDPSRSQEVSDTLWQIHAEMNTTCSGSSFSSTYAPTANKIIRDGWNIPEYSFRLKSDPSFDDCRHVYDEWDSAFMFSGRGEWQDILHSAQLRGLQPLDVAGHSTVCWGWFYDPPGPKTLKVALGWGALFGSKYVDFDSFSSKSICYVTY